jgi:hypothetical protein
MMGGVFKDVTEWFLLAVGALCLIEGVLLARRRSGAQSRFWRRQPLVTFCVGVMFVPDAAARIWNWAGPGMVAATAVSLAGGVTVIALSSQSIKNRSAASTRDRS